MDRKEMKKYANGYVKQGMKIVIDELIDTIADDIESRTCDNCKFCYINSSDGKLACNIYIFTKLVDKDFGCNKFEGKKDEEI